MRGLDYALQVTIALAVKVLCETKQWTMPMRWCIIQPMLNELMQ